MEGLVYRNPERVLRQGDAAWVQCETGGLVKVVGTGATKYVALGIREVEGVAHNGNLKTKLGFEFVRIGPTGKAPKGFRVLAIEEWTAKGGA